MENLLEEIKKCLRGCMALYIETFNPFTPKLKKYILPTF